MIDLNRKEYQVFEQLGVKDEIQTKLVEWEEYLSNWQDYPIGFVSIILYNWFLNTMAVPMFLNGFSSWERAFFEGDMDEHLLNTPNIEKDAERTFNLLKGYHKAEMVLSRIKNPDTCERLINALKDKDIQRGAGIFCSLLRGCEERQIIETYTANYVKALLVYRDIYRNFDNGDNVLDLMEENGLTPPFDYRQSVQNKTTIPNKTLLIEDFTDKYSDIISNYLETIYVNMVPLCNQSELMTLKQIVRNRDTKFDDYFRWAFAVLAEREEIIVEDCDITQYNELLIDHYSKLEWSPRQPISIECNTFDLVEVKKIMVTPERVIGDLKDDVRLEHLLLYLAHNGFISNSQHVLNTFASRLTGKSYMDEPELDTIEWTGELKHLVFLLKHSTTQKVEWDKVLQFFKADGMAEHSAKLSNLTKNVGPNDSFRREMMKFGIIEEKKYEKRQR